MKTTELVLIGVVVLLLGLFAVMYFSPGNRTDVPRGSDTQIPE